MRIYHVIAGLTALAICMPMFYHVAGMALSWVTAVPRWHQYFTSMMTLLPFLRGFPPIPPILQPIPLASKWPASGCDEVDRNTQSLALVTTISLNESIAAQTTALSELGRTLETIEEKAPRCKQMFKAMTGRKNLFVQVRRSSRVAHESFVHAVKALRPIFVSSYFDFTGLLTGSDEHLHKQRLLHLSDSLEQFALARKDIAAARKLVQRYNDQLISLSAVCLAESQNSPRTFVSRLWYFIFSWPARQYLDQDIVTEFDRSNTLNTATFQFTLKNLDSRSCRFMHLLHKLDKMSPSTSAVLGSLQKEITHTVQR